MESKSSDKKEQKTNSKKRTLSDFFSTKKSNEVFIDKEVTEKKQKLEQVSEKK